MIRRFSQLLSISPLDGRYSSKVSELSKYFSESALIKYRVKVEVCWLIHLAQNNILKDNSGKVLGLAPSDETKLNSLWKDFGVEGATWVKTKEKEVNHDLKAVEYFLKEHTHLQELKEYFHVCCTSEDINNLSYSLMVHEAVQQAVIPALESLVNNLQEIAALNSSTSMMSRTHGQPASPTTLGKEIANFAYRLSLQLRKLKQLKMSGKCNGAVGNYNSHVVTFPGVNWINLSQKFVEGLGLEWNPYTTQIEPHDCIAEMCSRVCHINTVLLDLCKDMWGYISLGYFLGEVKEKEVGSSTMPHKVNPIYFENAEGNLGVANAILKHLEEKLPVSRFQRDLSDSTALRNIGTGLGHCILSYKSIEAGFARLKVNEKKLKDELNQHWELLAEPVQMVLRRFGYEQPYELLKKFTRGKESLSREEYFELIQRIKEEYDLPGKIVAELESLKPETYIGYAEYLGSSVKKFTSE